MQTRAIVLVYRGSEIRSDDKYRLIQCLTNADIITDGSVTTYTLSEEDLVKNSVESLLTSAKQSTLSEKEILQKASDFIKAKYSQQSQKGDVYVIIQMISDIHNNTEDAEMLRNCITALAEYPDEAFITKNNIMSPTLLKNVKLIYNNHLV